MVEYAEHQRNAISYQQVVPNSILAMATGTGKTVTTIGSELVNLQNDKLDKCIFVCTKGSIGEVINDYNKHYNFVPTQLNSQDALYQFFNNDKKIAVTRYEWLKHFDEGFLREHVASHRLGMWWDEAQRLKNGSKDRHQSSGTNAHKSAKLIKPYCSAFHLVTATPVMTSLDDLWGLMHLVDNKALDTYEEFCKRFYVRELVPHPKVSKRRKTCKFCKSHLVYVNGWDYCTNRYCQAIQTPTGFIPYREKVRSIYSLVEYQNIDVLSRIMQKYMFCFFPEQDINYIEHKFEMSTSTELNYYAIAKDLIDKIDADIPTPFGTRLIQLQYLVDRSQEKMFELYKVVNQVKHKGFVLYTSFYESMDCVTAVLDKVEGLEYRTYSGKDCDEDKDENKKWFQSDPTNKCLIITEAGGASLNLQVTNEFIFYNLPAGFGKMSQALGRVVRLFSTFKSFNIHFILAEHSVDIYKYTGFLMYSEIMQKLMNNKLINLEKPISFNSHVKSEMRRDLCWRST